jgi:high-affinity iron transporter
MRQAMTVAACLFGLALSGDTAAHPPRGQWSRVLSLLQYIEADYVEAIEENSEKELLEQARMAADSAEEARATGSADPIVLMRLRDLEEIIRARATPIEVHETCGALITDIVRVQGLTRAPPAVPDVPQGKELYAKHCAPCHGERRGEVTQMAAAMDPRPPSFFLADVMNPLTPWKAFNLTTHGIPGTTMPSFAGLTDSERWAIAFYVFTLREPACSHPVSPVPIELLSTLSDNELVARFGEAQLPCLRRAMSVSNSHP